MENLIVPLSFIIVIIIVTITLRNQFRPPMREKTTTSLYTLEQKLSILANCGFKLAEPFTTESLLESWNRDAFEKPGFDLLVNIIGAGVICTIAGWITAQPLTQIPALFLLIPVFGVAGIYMPTTIIDYEPDILEELKTITTKIGKKNSFYLGLTSVILANLTIIAMGLLNYIISPKFLLYTWPLMLIEILTYWYLLRKLDFAGGYFAILTFSIYAAIGNGLILFYNAGLLQLP